MNSTVDQQNILLQRGLDKVEEEKAEASKKKKVTMMIVLLLLVIILILGLVIYKLLHKEPENRGTVAGFTTEEEEETDPTFTTDMNMTWHFPSGGRKSENAVIGNSSENKYPTYFELYLDNEEQTLLYSSPLIPVGKRLGELEIDETLPDGIYVGICTFHIMSNRDRDKELSRVSFEVALKFGD